MKKVKFDSMTSKQLLDATRSISLDIDEAIDKGEYRRVDELFKVKSLVDKNLQSKAVEDAHVNHAVSVLRSKGIDKLAIVRVPEEDGSIDELWIVDENFESEPESDYVVWRGTLSEFLECTPTMYEISNVDDSYRVINAKAEMCRVAALIECIE